MRIGENMTTTETTPSRTARRYGPGKLTTAKRAEFLRLYAEPGATVRSAAAKIGVSAVAIFKLVRRDEEFAAAYREALELALDNVEDDIHTLACQGNLTAMFGLLRARRPSVWRESGQAPRGEGGSFAAAFADAMKRLVDGPGS